jgi:hypothetical protein
MRKILPHGFTSMLLLLVLHVQFDQSIAFNYLHNRARRTTYECEGLQSALIDLDLEIEFTVKDIDVIEPQVIRRTVPIVNTAGMNISASNFFGKQVLSIKECKSELTGLLSNTIEIEEEFLNYRIEYLTKYLEYKYIPIQTIPFLNFALTGEWAMLYSNTLRPREDPTLAYEIFQEITPNPEERSTEGTINNIINWKLNRIDDQSCGDLVVNCNYKFNTKGDLDLTLIDHLLMPKAESPKDVEDLIMTIQRSVPFESFDPDGILAHITVSQSFLFS